MFRRRIAGAVPLVNRKPRNPKRTGKARGPPAQVTDRKAISPHRAHSHVGRAVLGRVQGVLRSVGVFRRRRAQSDWRVGQGRARRLLLERDHFGPAIEQLAEAEALEAEFLRRELLAGRVGRRPASQSRLRCPSACGPRAPPDAAGACPPARPRLPACFPSSSRPSWASCPCLWATPDRAQRRTFAAAAGRASAGPPAASARDS